MGRHALLAVVILLLVTLGAVGIFLFRYANLNSDPTSRVVFKNEQNFTDNKKEKSSWMSELADVGKKD